MPLSPLSRDAATRGLAVLGDQIGRADLDRLEKLLPLISDDCLIPLAGAMKSLYPGDHRKAALTLLRQMRARLAHATAEAKIVLALDVDARTRSTPERRFCWFTGEDQAAEAAARFTARETAGVVRGSQDAERLVRYFVSYAHRDHALKDDLVNRLHERFGSASAYRFEPWQDHDIILGGDWHDQIQAAIEACDFGLLLLSPAFLASRYIKEHELPQFVGSDPSSAKHLAPVALKVIALDGTMNLRGLEQRQIFRDQRGRAYEQRETDRDRNDFANRLFAEIVRMLGGPVLKIPELPDPPDKQKDNQERVELESMARYLADIHFTPAHARASTVEKLENEPVGDERQDAVIFLEQWLRDPKGQPCGALLAETGMGKTTTSKAFAHRLRDARQADKSIPLPIYLDLRLLAADAASLPRLDSIIDTVLRRSWQGGRAESPPSAAEVQRLVREEGAVIIFDGLDEVLVHPPSRAGQQFTRELLSVLPPTLWPRRRKPETPGRPGRILLTCRTHYFRSVRDQYTHLTAEDRDDVRDTDYRVFMLLRFTNDQIRAYLTASLPGADIDRVLETIHSVHNLPELAERPYTLSLITRHLPQIERWKLDGRRVTGVDLYRHMVLSWLERDAGKHELEADHKQQIMEHVAARLWRSGSRTWTARQMEDWLAEFLDTTPSIARHYRHKELEVLKQDLRTATFLVGGGKADFRFAHTSLQEFFLAAFLLRALRDSRPEDWDMARPSLETMDFLGQMLLGEADGPALATLRAMRGTYRPRISELAFHYVLFASSLNYPAPSPAGFILDGADLRDWVIEGRDNGPSLNLRGGSLRGARLSNAVFRFVDLDTADFSGAELLRAEINRGRAKGTRFAGATLVGTVFRNVDPSDAAFTGASLYRTQFLRCAMPRRLGPVMAFPWTMVALCQPAETNVVISQQISRLAALGGHESWVMACAFSPDGGTIASASYDKTIRLGDAATGQQTGFRVLMLGGGTFASVTADGTRIIQVSPEAWRNLGWLVPDESGALTRYPAEVFGPLPEYKE